MAQRDQAKAQVLQQKAAVEAAKLQLSHCTIRAPIDGTVVNRTVTLGAPIAASPQSQTCSAVDKISLRCWSTPTPTRRTSAASDPARRLVSAWTRFRETFEGVVNQQRMNATTIQNVVMYNTTIAFDNPDLKLFPA